MTDLAAHISKAAGVYSPSHSSEVHVIAHSGHRRDGTRRGILSAHAAGQSAWQGLLWMVPLYLAHRWPLAIADCGDPTVTSGTNSGPYNWGNDTAISRLAELRTLLQTAPTLAAPGGGGAKTGVVGGFGGSMGSIQLLNYARANPSQFCCLGLVIPAINLNDMYQNDKGGFRASIGAAYGVTYPTAIPNLATHSPLDGDPSDFIHWPIKIWASDNDTIAATTAMCQTWADAVNDAGGDVEVTSIGAVGHDTATTPVDEVVDWFSRNMAV